MRSKKVVWDLWRTVSVIGAWAHEYQGVRRGEIALVIAGGWEKRMIIRAPRSRSIHGMGSTECLLAFRRGQDWLPKAYR